VPYLFTDTPDGRATEFLKTRMGTDAFDALVERGYVDVPIPDDQYRLGGPMGGVRLVQHGAIRVTAGGTVNIVHQGTNNLCVSLCVYVVLGTPTDENFLRSIPLADRVFTFWFLARVDPQALLRAANA